MCVEYLSFIDAWCNLIVKENAHLCCGYSLQEARRMLERESDRYFSTQRQLSKQKSLLFKKQK